MKNFIIAAEITTVSFALIAGNVFGDEPPVSSEIKTTTAPAIYACNDPGIVLAPYVWKSIEVGSMLEIEATMPGAYIKTMVRGTTSIGIRIDGKANNGHPPGTMPMIEYSVDQHEFQAVTLTQTGVVYTLSLATGLDAQKPHRLDFYFRAADLEQKRWQTSMSHLRLAGLAVDPGGSLVAPSVRPKRAIIYGDSITEGVGSEALFTTWKMIAHNNARTTWCPITCAALDCEYGQLGSGGLGVSNSKLEMPPLKEIWDRYDSATSRLTDGLLRPEPDYIFCELGTNDPGINITRDYIRWLIAMRTACPHAKFFCIVPPLGVHETEVQEAVSSRNNAGDGSVYVIETARLKDGFRAGQGSTEFGYDGVHPSMYGHAMLGSLIAVEAAKALSGKD